MPRVAVEREIAFAPASHARHPSRLVRWPSNLRVPLALVCAVVAISFAAICFEKAEPTHPLVASATRMSLAGLALAPFTIRGLAKRTLDATRLRAALLAGVLYALHFGTWVASLSLTSVAASVTLVTVTPLVLAVHSRVTGRDQASRRQALAIAVATVGVVLVGGADLSISGDALAGDLLALAGAIAMAMYLALARSLGPALDVWTFTGVATAVSGALLFLTALATGVPIAIPSEEAFVYLALAAVVPQIGGHSLLTWALKHTSPTVVGLATVGEPVVATLLAVVWLGQTPTALVLFGCGITASAVVLALLPSRDAPDPR